MRTILVLSLAALLGSCVYSDLFVDLDPDLNRMVFQPRADPYEPSPVFEDGMVMQVPPEGSVARDVPLGDIAYLTGRTEDGDWVEHIPTRVDLPLLMKGRERFDIFCAACHGRSGDGATFVASRMELVKPPALYSERIRRLPPGQLFEVATNGYGMMPGYELQLDHYERWAVVAYLQALQLSRHAEIASLPDPVRARVRARLQAPARATTGEEVP